jgi:hypothetical protein
MRRLSLALNPRGEVGKRCVEGDPLSASQRREAARAGIDTDHDNLTFRLLPAEEVVAIIENPGERSSKRRKPAALLEREAPLHRPCTQIVVMIEAVAVRAGVGMWMPISPGSHSSPGGVGTNNGVVLQKTPRWTGETPFSRGRSGSNKIFDPASSSQVACDL